MLFMKAALQQLFLQVSISLLRAPFLLPPAPPLPTIFPLHSASTVFQGALLKRTFLSWHQVVCVEICGDRPPPAPAASVGAPGGPVSKELSLGSGHPASVSWGSSAERSSGSIIRSHTAGLYPGAQKCTSESDAGTGHPHFLLSELERDGGEAAPTSLH